MQRPALTANAKPSITPNTRRPSATLASSAEADSGGRGARKAPIFLQSADVGYPERDVAGGNVGARRVDMAALVVEEEIGLERL